MVGVDRLNDFRHHSPLVVHLERRRDCQQMLLTVNRACGNQELRTKQASGLRE